ncbi:MAG: adenylyltransferase/cytidyltransferase family protein [Patescibacteria group bacterium]
MKIVMIFGTFDIVHCGHLHMFREAKEYGGKLIAVVGRDANVEKVKGFLPIHNEKERLFLVENIKLVDQAVLGDKTDVYKVIEKFKPDIIALGYDQKMYVDELAEAITKFGLKTRIVKLKPYHENQYKSSKIKKYIERIV